MSDSDPDDTQRERARRFADEYSSEYRELYDQLAHE
jgi:hypothetical protein